MVQIRVTLLIMQNRLHALCLLAYEKIWLEQTVTLCNPNLNHAEKRTACLIITSFAADNILLPILYPEWLFQPRSDQQCHQRLPVWRLRSPPDS